MLTNGPSKDLQAHIVDRGQVINTHMTLIAMDGSVLTGSNPRIVSDAVPIKNQKDRPELVSGRQNWLR